LDCQLQEFLMKGFKQLALCCGGLLIAASATAGMPSVYGTLGFGYTEALDMPSADDYAVISPVDTGLDSTRTNYGGRIALGALWNTDKFLSPGLEIGAASYGSYKYSSSANSIQMDYYGIEFLALVQANMKNLKFILKAGLDDERMDMTATGITTPGMDNNSAISPEFGVGIGYKFTPKLQLNATYYRVVGDNVNFNNSSDADNLPSFNIAFLEATYYFTSGQA
jgi:hypothetical protein